MTSDKSRITYDFSIFQPYWTIALKVKRERIDKLIVEKGLAESRAKAQAMVMAGVVLVNEQRVNKPSDLVSYDSAIRVKRSDDPTSKYVGRGGLKLEAALKSFQINPTQFVCLDVGSSTGGFTDCLLQSGAKQVFAIDVGHNQLDWRLRQDPRVISREGVNARYLEPSNFPALFDLIVVDVSFISLAKVLPALVSLATADGALVTLIKPQFEVGRGEVGSGGIVRDPTKRQRVIEEVTAVAVELGLRCEGVIESPIQGAEGNVEFLAHFVRDTVLRF
jgi:23S rRNA (cytidine1920-2'-O)/16S rRNA (cytidine1409-2'-O)-methyltransferase